MNLSTNRFSTIAGTFAFGQRHRVNEMNDFRL